MATSSPPKRWYTRGGEEPDTAVLYLIATPVT